MRPFALAVTFAALLPAPVAATTFVPQEVDCPVCGLHLEALAIASTSSLGASMPGASSTGSPSLDAWKICGTIADRCPPSSSAPGPLAAEWA